MQSAARSLVRAHSSSTILPSRSNSWTSYLPFRQSRVISPAPPLHSLRSASNDANRSTIKSQVKSASMANVQPFLRVGIRNMGGEAPIDVEVFGKAAAGTGSPSQVRGDCPFSQRIYLDLEEKNIPYKATYIQEGHEKPDWFMARNPQGLMPVLRHGEHWIQDSDKIAQYLEENFPEPSLKTLAEYKNIGSGIFMAFTSYLKSQNPEDSTKLQLMTELKALDDHFKAHWLRNFRGIHQLPEISKL